MKAPTGVMPHERRSWAILPILALRLAGAISLSEEHRGALELMPRPEDYTHMWWAEGFPTQVSTAPWRRVIRTGRYAIALDTETLQVPHFGVVRTRRSYAEAGREGNQVWKGMPGAELELEVTLEGKVYRAVGGGKWSLFAGPRVVESGRFLQRADVTGLTFAAEDGTPLDVEARFETAAWPDRLGLIFAARPGTPVRSPEGESVFKTNRVWRNTSMEIRLGGKKGVLRRRQNFARGETWDAADWREVFLALDPVKFREADTNVILHVEASEIPGGASRPVGYDAARGWHRVDLDGIAPMVPPGRSQNDALERVRLVLSNPTPREETARLLFEKKAGGFRQPIGSPVTGISAVLRDRDGYPTGIPVQLSKNWHNRPEGGVYAGAWFHGFSQVRLPPRASVELELTLAYGHWGGVPAASHAQLCLIGWGSNQVWDESALGAWGESICYEPDQAQAQAAVLDVRPLMVHSMSKNQLWNWTHNVGGADFFRAFDEGGARVPPARIRVVYERQGPCLTEVTYAGRLGDYAEHAATVSLARGDDIVRGTYCLRLDVKRPTKFSRFVIFQIGADSYSYTGERKMAWGNETGLQHEWATLWGGDTYRTTPVEAAGRTPWISLHEAVPRPRPNQQGDWANRGVVIRSWKARLGGRNVSPWIAERGVKARGEDTSTIDILPPPGVKALAKGDFVEATFEHIVVPQFAEDYYGPNESLRSALKLWENSWRMIHREATGNDRKVVIQTGALDRLYPAVTIRTVNGKAEFTLTGGHGYVPVTFSGLTSPRGYVLLLDGQSVDQSVHGNDFWQTDFDPATRCWSQTYTLPVRDFKTRSIRLQKQ